MSNSIIPLDTAKLTADAINAALQEKQLCDATQEPFSVTRLRSQMLGLVRQFFSNEQTFDPTFDPPGSPTLCLSFNPEKPSESSLRVESAFSLEPPELGESAVYVRVPSVTFTKVVIGDYGGTSQRTQHTYYEKSFKGTIAFFAQHKMSDVAVTLLERLQTHLECTKHNWMSGMQLMAFEVTTMNDAQVIRSEPEPAYRAQMMSEFTGRAVFRMTEASLPLKRVSVDVITDAA